MPHGSYHTQLHSSEQPPVPEAEWQHLLTFLPEGAYAQARTLRAFERARGLRSEADLLRGILAYAFCLSSFRQVGCWAISIGLSSNGARSWAKRTRQAASWLLWLLHAILAPEPSPIPGSLPSRFAGRIHLVDATHLRPWKRTGEYYRLHMSYDLLGQRLEQVVMTDQHTGEGLGHFRHQPGDITVADSAYCRRQALISHLDAGEHFVVRLHWATTPLLHPDGSSFDLSAWLTQIEEGRGEHAVCLRLQKRQVSLRLVAVHLSEAAATRAQHRRTRRASKNGVKNQPLTIQIADWLVVLTSLPTDPWTGEHVLSLYRARWHIELLFKRIKQLVRVHRLRSQNLQSNQAVMAAMLLGWALIETKARHLRQQMSAQGSGQESSDPQRRLLPLSSWQVSASVIQSLRTMILGMWTWSQIQSHLDAIRTLLTVPPQQRGHHESQINEHLAHLLSLVVS